MISPFFERSQLLETMQSPHTEMKPNLVQKLVLASVNVQTNRTSMGKIKGTNLNRLTNKSSRTFRLIYQFVGPKRTVRMFIITTENKFHKKLLVT